MIRCVGETPRGETGDAGLEGKGRFCRERAVSNREGRGGLLATIESEEWERLREMES